VQFKKTVSWGEMLAYLEASGCRRKRHGRKHEIWVGPGGWSTVPRHASFGRAGITRICKQLGVTRP
jgi:hypothetical protein